MLNNALFLFILLFCSLIANAQSGQDLIASDKQSTGFIENKGQIVDQYGNKRADILFAYQTKSIQIFVTEKGLSYQFAQPKKIGDKEIDKTHTLPDDTEYTIDRVDVEFVNTISTKVISKEAPTGYKENYYLAQCMDGITGLQAFSKITLKNIYPGIDWILYAGDNYLKYDFEVRKGADASQIKLKYNGAKKLFIDDEGNLNVNSHLGFIKEIKPLYIVNGEQQKGEYILEDATLTFNTNNNSKQFVGTIDPKIIWGTYYGGNQNETFHAVKMDVSNNFFICGSTGSISNISTLGAYQIKHAGSSDVMLIKFDQNGNRIWGTYYGASKLDIANDLVLDNNSNIYLVGHTTNDTIGYTTTGCFQNKYGGGISDGFAMKFDSSGKRIWSTFIGSSSTNALYEKSEGIEYNPSKNEIYIVGNLTDSIGIITASSHQKNFGGGSDAYLITFDTSGKLKWGTFYGGTKNENELTVHYKNNKIYLGGVTASTNNIATMGTHDPYFSNAFLDAFLVSFNDTGKRDWGTYYSDDGYNNCGAIAADNDSNIYIGGYSSGTSKKFGTPGTFYSLSSSLSGTAYLTKFNKHGKRIWGTYLGLSSGSVLDILVDKNTDIIFVGYGSGSSIFPSNSAFQPVNNGNVDGILAKFDSTGNRSAATFYGGNNSDILLGVVQDSKGYTYIVGETESTTKLAVPNGHQTTYVGSREGLIAKFDTCWPFIQTQEDLKYICPSQPITYRAKGGKTYLWQNNSTSDSATFSPSVTTNYWVKGYNSQNCFDSTWISIYVPPLPTAIITGPENVCKDDTVLLEIVGNFSGLNWNTGHKTSKHYVSPDTATLYWCKVSNFIGCGDTLFKTVNVSDQYFDVKILGTNRICKGDTITLTATSGKYYLWSTGEGTSQINVSPQILTIYTIIGQNDSGCIDTASFTVGVNNALANVQIKSKDSICLNDTIQFQAIGYKKSFIWSTGDTTEKITLKPTTTITVIFDYTDSLGCRNTTNKAVVVKPVPTVKINGKDTLCEGEIAALTASGAKYYMWNIADTAKTINVTPKNSSQYTVIGSTQMGCVGKDSFYVFVKAKPIFNISGSNSVYEKDTIAYSVPPIPGYNFNWTVNNGSIVSSPTYYTSNIKWDSAGTGEVLVKLTDITINKCIWYDTLEVIINPLQVNPIGIEETDQMKIIVYPNPFSESLNIINPTEGIAHYTLHTLDGRIINSGEYNRNYTVSTHSLPTGIYLLTLNGITIKMIKH